MEAKSNCITLTSFSILGSLLCIFALNAILYAGTEHSYAHALHKLVVEQNAQIQPQTPCNCTNTPPSAKEVPQECPKTPPSEFSPWYQEGRAWHYPIKFPRCTMDVCFNYSRCDNMEELLIYTYPYPPALRFLADLNKTKWHTDDPGKACLFFLFTETSNPYRGPYPEHPSNKPYWNGGLNHVLVSYSDFWDLTHIDQASIGKASLLRTDTHESIYRPGFDISMSHPPLHRFDDLQSFKPWERKYLLAFRGLQYIGGPNVLGGVRSFESFKELHNGDDIIVASSCRHPSNAWARNNNATVKARCEKEEEIYRKFGNYKDIMNSTFGLCPAGRQPSLFRFTEVLSGGGIPVLIADNYVKPYDTLVQWHRCALQFPTTEVSRIVPTLRKMTRFEMEKRQEYCLKVYRTYLASDETLIKAVVDSFKARFMGAVPGLMPDTSL